MKALKAVQIEIPEGFSLKAYGPMGRELRVINQCSGHAWVYNVECDLVVVIAGALALEACLIARNAGLKMIGSLYPLTPDTAKTLGVSIWLSSAD